MPKFGRYRIRGCTLFLVASLLLLRHSLASTYYVSPRGNDSSNGKSPPSAWQTLERVSRAVNKLVKGDSVLFERGGVFPGSLWIVSNEIAIQGIYLGAYGVGENPTVSGAVEITNWKPFKLNIWMATWPSAANAPSDLFLDGIRQTLGRYPNSGYNSITNVADTKVFQDSKLTDPDDRWSGAEVVIRCNRWILNKLHIKKYHRAEFYLDSTSSYPIHTGNEYFIQSHLATLDQPGEWFFDPDQHLIYLVLSPGVQPNTHLLTASTLKNGIVVRNASEITLENLTVRFFEQTAVEIVSCNVVTMRNCTIGFSGNVGLQVIDCDRPIFERNTVTDIHNVGVYWVNVRNGAFISNTIRRSGVIPGRSKSGDGSNIGLFITANTAQVGRNIVQYNLIDSIGYSAIDFRSGNTLIKNNVIRNFCMVKEDGAGIYTWHNSFGENSIEENIVLYSEAPTYTPKSLVSGIYVDDLSSNIVVKKNTVAYCPTAGIYIHNASKINVVENVLFGNGTNLLEDEKGQLYIKYDVATQELTLDRPELAVRNNSFTSIDETTACVLFNSDFIQDYTKIGRLSSNIYQAENPTQAVVEVHSLQTICDAPQHFDLMTWQQESALDSASVFYPLRVPNDQPRKDLIANGTFEINDEGWITWPPVAKHSIDATALSGNSSLRASVFIDHPGALLYYNTVSLKKEKVYRLSFDAIASRPSNLQFVVLTGQSPWNSISRYVCFGVDKKPRRYSCYFQTSESSDGARVNFKFRNTLWIDNVSIQEMQPNPPKNNAVTLVCNSTNVPVLFSEDGTRSRELSPFSSIVINGSPKQSGK